MSATTEHLVQWLQRNKDPVYLIRWLCKRGGDYKTLCHALEQIRNLWCDVYGDKTVKKSDGYHSCVQRLDKSVSHLDASINKLVKKFLQLPFCQQYHLQAQGMLHDYTGCAAIDVMLNELVVLPPYIQGLRVTCRGPKSTTKAHSVTQQAFSAKASSVGVPYARASVAGASAPALSTGAKRRRMSPPNSEPAKKDGNVTKRKVSKVLRTSRAKPFELACALAFVSGRSLAELMALGYFSSSTGDSSIDPASPCPEVLFTLQHSNSSSCYSVPLLCDKSTFLAGIDRLRQLKVVQSKECKDINKSHCKTANTAAKNLLGCSTAVFTDLRIAYVALTFRLYGNRPDSINEALERQMKAWLEQCLPLAKLSKSPAFLAQCCATYLASSQLPASCRREVSVAVAYRDSCAGALPHERDAAAAEPRKIMDTHSIVLKVLPLLVRMYYCQARQMSSAQGRNTWVGRSER
jgi:hypothetical protein